jgi:hypothetical protein
MQGFYLPARRRIEEVIIFSLRLMALAAIPALAAAAGHWQRHAIDNTSKGADGVRLADVNGDGLPDIATGWEEGGSIRVYLNPGPGKARQPWPRVVVGSVRSPEDAVLADLDGDGALDVVSSCEGKERSIFVHWAPRNRRDILSAGAWRAEFLPEARSAAQWMFAVPVQLDGKHGLDLAAGAKNDGAHVGWFEAPAKPRDLGSWKWHPLRPAGWIMSLIASDMDGDGDPDLLFSDRKGPRSGVFWLDNPGPGPAQARPWPEHRVGGQGAEVMFLDTADLDGDGLQDVLTAAKPRHVLVHRRRTSAGRAWETRSIGLPETAGTAKSVRAGDIDGDGRLDLVFSCEGAVAEKAGVMWLSQRTAVGGAEWQPHDISGPQGVKYDLIELVDLDGDGDLDVLTCEETDNLGVIWYENPGAGRL